MMTIYVIIRELEMENNFLNHEITLFVLSEYETRL